MVKSSDCIARWGDVRDEKVRLRFEREQMTLWLTPIEIKEAIPALPKRIYMNRLLVEPFEKTLKKLIEKGLNHEIVTFDGCFNIRVMRGLSSLSMHSFGIAVDLNAAQNPLNGQVTWTDDFLEVWRENFDCGADWFTRVDGMHFQLRKI